MMCDRMCEHYDLSFDFTSDTPGYWDRFWENRNELGVGSADPDMTSPMLKEYHKSARNSPTASCSSSRTTPAAILDGTG